MSSTDAEEVLTLQTDLRDASAIAHPHSPAEFPAFLSPPVPILEGPHAAPTTDRSVYLHVARTLLPRWLRIIEPAPWLSALTEARPLATEEPFRLFIRTAASLAMGLLRERDDMRPDADYLHACLRTAVIQWQSALRADGSPGTRRNGRSPWYGGTLYYIVQLVTETGGLQSNMLLADIDAHLRWLSRRPPVTPWLEAYTICALADGALLIRDTAPLQVARRRLGVLLAGQDEEGWFAECGGPDIGRLSLTVDALALLYRNHGWPELSGPLASAIRFLTHFVHPDGSVGGCYSTCQSAFLSPLGLELMASQLDEATVLAFQVRNDMKRLAGDAASFVDDGLVAVLGASAATAAVYARALREVVHALPHQQTGRTRFPNAGMSIFSNAEYHAVVAEKNGGALRVTWRRADRSLDDAGVVLVGVQGLRWGARRDGRKHTQISSQGHDPAHTSVVCTGILGRDKRVTNGWWRGIQRFLGRAGRLAGLLRRREPAIDDSAQPVDVFRGKDAALLAHRSGNGSGDPGGGANHRRRVLRRLTHDYFQRHIQFRERSVVIGDAVACRLPCRALIVQSPIPPNDEPFAGRIAPASEARAPLLIDGGRHIYVTRVYQDGVLVGPVNGAWEAD